MMSTANSFQEIALFNHKGAVALACGNDREAHGIFKSIVEVLGQLSQRPEVGEGGSLQTRVLSTLPIPDLKDERFFIFGEVLIYQGNNVAPNALPSMVDLCLCSCISLFNMAVTYHRRAKVTGIRHFYVTASRVYEQALSIASSITDLSDDVDSLKIVILNNLAQIYYFELDFYTEALQRLGRAKIVMEGLEGMELGFEAQSRDEIYLNLLLTKPPSTAGCA